ncbi:hypothetical protein ABVK25_006449 [Lepraria finkii]|uniref:Uncharacterized protein n=1 Tax=Lepraria finkii TaxID=1340010 RepID=A0ABR4B5S9_9LECA
MTPILASTRSAFFQQYDFDFNPRAALHTEFRRLANFRKWKQGSNRMKFEKAWMQCFGSEVPVNYNFDGNGSLVSAPYGADNEDFASLLGSLQSLNLGGRKQKARVQRGGAEFASYYGSDAHVTERWQELCQDCGINPVPPSINQCKKALKGVNINIYHLLDAKKARRMVHHFRSGKELSVYMENNPDQKFPLKVAKENKFLRALLILCW